MTGARWRRQAPAAAVGQRNAGRFCPGINLAAAAQKERRTSGELTSEVLGDRGGAEKAVNGDQQVVDDELWCTGVLVIGGMVGDFGEQ